MRGYRALPIAVLTSLAAGCAAVGLPDKPVPRDFELSPYEIPLKSGLRVVVLPDHSTPLVTVVSAYGVGGTSDPKGVEGLAHFIEHLAFRTRPGNVQVWDHLKRLGADFNAFTSQDMTVYFETAHKDVLNEMLQIEAWRLSRTLDGVTPEVFTTEREVVRNELRQRGETTVNSKQFQALLGSLFPPDHLMSRAVVGTHESLTAATLDHARAFVRAHYRPENCAMVVYGDVDPEAVKKMLGAWPAELLFGPQGPEGPAVAPRRPVVGRPVAPTPEPHTRTLARHKGPVVQPQLLIGWTAPGAHRGNDALLGFTAARLNLALREGIETDYDDDLEGVGAGVAGFDGAAVFYVQADLRPGANPDKAYARILDALVHAWTTELGPLQTEATRWGSATSLLLRLGNATGIATAVAEHMLQTGRSRHFSDTLEELLAVKSGEVMDLANKWLRRERAAAVYFEPENDEAPRLIGGGSGGGRSTVASAQAGQHDIGREASSAATELGPQRILQIARSPGLANYPRFTLANGLQIVAVRYGSAPVAQIMMGIRGGDAFTQPYGLGRYASRFARSTCREHGDLFPVGGWLGRMSGATSSLVQVDVLSGNLANGVAVLADSIGCLEASEEGFLFHERALELQGRDYQRAAKLPDFSAFEKFWSELYPGHPYGVTAVNPATLKGIKFEDVSGFIRGHFRPQNAVAVMVGDLTAPEVRTLAEKYLTSWQGGGGTAGGLPPVGPGPASRRVFLVDRPAATQATVQIGCRLPDASAESVPTYDLLEALANERVWSIREQYGATYGVHAGVTLRPGGAADLVLSGAIENRQAGASIARLLDLVAGLAGDGLDERAFLLKRWDVAREFSRRFGSASAIAQGILEAVEQNWPADVWDQYPKRLAATSRGKVSELLKTCVGHEIVTLAGDAKVLAPQLAAAGLNLTAP